MATSLHLLVFGDAKTEKEQEENVTEIYVNSRDNIVVVPGKIGLLEIKKEDWVDIKNFIDREFSKI